MEIGGRLGDPQRAGACGDEQRGPAGERDPLIDRARRRIDVRDLALREAADVRATAASCDDPGRLGERRPRSSENEGRAQVSFKTARSSEGGPTPAGGSPAWRTRRGKVPDVGCEVCGEEKRLLG